MTIHFSFFPEEVSNWILTNCPSITKIQSISPDGSTRSFFRIISSSKSYMLLYDPKFLLSADYPVHQRYLFLLGVKVPQFYAVNEKLGCILMEDLGNELLQSKINAEPKIPWLKKAIASLAHLHASSYPLNTDIPASKRFFDQNKFKEELLFTFEHFVEKFLNLKPLNSGLLEKLASFCKIIAEIKPQTFSHRDYHSRNLMVYDGNLYMIDFQDARTGPIHYDVASLLFDSYLPLNNAERDLLCDHYKSSLVNTKLNKDINWNSFKTDLTSVAVQRVIKAIGSFASFYTRFKKTTHLKYLVPALLICRELLSIKDKECYRALFDIETWLEKTQNHPLIKPFLIK